MGGEETGVLVVKPPKSSKLLTSFHMHNIVNSIPYQCLQLTKVQIQIHKFSIKVDNLRVQG